MRFLYVKLVGYIGLYSGLGLKEIELDFSKARNKICVISGPNGVGKSTIINALNLMPDDNACFIPSMEASKYLKLTDGNNIYDITMHHGINSHNERTTTKISILKNGVELNPNGNVKSYKDIIQNEFELDSNYSVLSKIGGNDRGIADKTPAERKKIVSSIISSLEVYNNIYKVLNKKANTLKSFINNLGYKIQNIGSEESLNSALAGISIRIDNLNKELDESKTSLTKSQTIVSLADPDGSIQNRLSDLKIQSESLSEKISSLYATIKRLQDKNTKSKDDIEEAMHSRELDKTKLLAEISSTSEKITSINNEIDQINIKISKTSQDINPELETTLFNTRNQMKGLTDLFHGINIEEVSKDEIDFVIKFCNSIVKQIDDLREDQNVVLFSQSCDDILSDIDLKALYNNELDRKEQTTIELDKEKDTLVRLKEDLAICKNLNIRPDKCKIDTCAFIKDAVEISNKYGGLKKLQILEDAEEKKVEELQYRLHTEIEESIKNLETRLNISTRIRRIIDSINLNNEILKKFPVSRRLIDLNLFLTDLKNQSIFAELRDMSSYQEMSNSIIEYKSLSKVLSNLEAEYKIQSNTQKMIEQYNKELEDKKSNLSELYSIFDKQRKDKEFNDGVLEGLQSQYKDSCALSDALKEVEDLNSNKSNIDKEIKSINDKMTKSLNEINNISNMTDRISKIENELKPLDENKKNIDAQLSMLRSFQQEYNAYKDQYNLIDILRKYSSPTSGSIQSLFMSIYMDKTLDTVNKLLGMIFNGQYQILQYVINENEFRIPFVGNGMIVDDISNGSTSQVCIMGMIINLVLFTTGSTKYNIVSLDEIDGGLDHQNRYLFVNILQQICDILNIDQLFIISHSVESALQAVDVVLLSDQEYYRNQFGAANIIYQYKERK